jgi:hypothetical protein
VIGVAILGAVLVVAATVVLLREFSAPGMTHGGRTCPKPPPRRHTAGTGSKGLAVPASSRPPTMETTGAWSRPAAELDPMLDEFDRLARFAHEQAKRAGHPSVGDDTPPWYRTAGVVTTLREWFDEFTVATGETPHTVVLGTVAAWHHPWPEYTPGVATSTIPDVVLDHPFDDGYGGNDSPNLCAWSPSWVLFSDNYDGSEGPRWVPRNPVDHNPIRPGGG